jgi:hypothetical protein
MLQALKVKERVMRNRNRETEKDHEKQIHERKTLFAESRTWKS